MTLVFLSPGMAGEIHVSAAASLKDVVNELADGFARENPGVRILRNYGGSGTLAKQIENGAPADLFVSANTQWMDYLKEQKMIAAPSVRVFAYNTLVFAGRAGKKISGLQDLPGLDRIAIGSPKSVPAGEYALEALKKAGVEKHLRHKLVMARDVRECLMYAERGEVDGAFVYKTDALQARVKIFFEVPRDFHPRVTCPMALTVSGSKNRSAERFHAFLQTEKSKKVAAEHGFAPE
ncbi:MAG TPA: molybdate ABC transporter substrate-binding protein [Thermodesulfobacteriota bacterium]|nr:molybdate ABC transporter substrate-binding protein [Thermodesulfobacteriota bacterium]